MRKFIFFAIFLLSVNFVYSQNLTREELDSLYTKLNYLNSTQFRSKSVQTIEGGSKYEKCGFANVVSAK